MTGGASLKPRPVGGELHKRGIVKKERAVLVAWAAFLRLVPDMECRGPSETGTGR